MIKKYHMMNLKENYLMQQIKIQNLILHKKKQMYFIIYIYFL